jgi:hypothetical protein
VTPPRFDDELFSRLDDLAGRPSPLGPSVLPGIRRRAATQRRRRGLAVMAVAVLLVGGVGTTRSVLTSNRAVTVPAVTVPTPTVDRSSPTTSGKLLPWPLVQGSGQAGRSTKEHVAALVDHVRLAWDDTSGPGHENVRLLLCSGTSSLVVVAEGYSSSGQPRMAVFTGVGTPDQDVESVQLSFQTDLPIPDPAPEFMVLTVRDPRSSASTQAALLNLPDHPVIRFRASNPADRHRIDEHLLNHSETFFRMEGGYTLADFTRGSVTVVGKLGAPDRRLQPIPPDPVTESVPSANGQWAALWVPEDRP